MSHFTTLIIGDDPEKQLEPFCEQTKDRKYTEFYVDGDWKDEWDNGTVDIVNMPDGRRLFTWDDEFKVKDESSSSPFPSYEKVIPAELEAVATPFSELYGNYETYMKEWNGTDKDPEKGEYGYWRNPNSKWDWYSLGGRWKDFFTLKDGTKADEAQLKDIDFDKMLEERLEEGEKSWEESETYIREQKLKDMSINDGTLYFQYGRGAKDTKESFMKGYQGVAVFSILKEGKWFEKGNMGWWGCVSDEKVADKWQDELTAVLDGVSPDTKISLYDCHI